MGSGQRGIPFESYAFAPHTCSIASDTPRSHRVYLVSRVAYRIKPVLGCFCSVMLRLRREQHVNRCGGGRWLRPVPHEDSTRENISRISESSGGVVKSHTSGHTAASGKAVPGSIKSNLGDAVG
jgi:hypothetical protein